MCQVLLKKSAITGCFVSALRVSLLPGAIHIVSRTSSSRGPRTQARGCDQDVGLLAVTLTGLRLSSPNWIYNRQKPQLPIRASVPRAQREIKLSSSVRFSLSQIHDLNVELSFLRHVPILLQLARARVRCGCIKAAEGAEGVEWLLRDACL